MFAVRIFGCLVGVLMVVYGVAVMDDALIGTGPCRANCSLYSALIRLFGQSTYNKLMGFSWVVAGVRIHSRMRVGQIRWLVRSLSRVLGHLLGGG